MTDNVEIPAELEEAMQRVLVREKTVLSSLLDEIMCLKNQIDELNAAKIYGKVLG